MISLTVGSIGKQINTWFYLLTVTCHYEDPQAPQNQLGDISHPSQAFPRFPENDILLFYNNFVSFVKVNFVKPKERRYLVSFYTRFLSLCH